MEKKYSYYYFNSTLEDIAEAMDHETEKYNIQVVDKLPDNDKLTCYDSKIDVICPWEIIYIKRRLGGYYKIEEVD